MNVVLGFCLLLFSMSASAYFPHENGNIKWISTDKPIFCLGEINFFDDNIGANVCSGYLYSTNNGGIDWNYVKNFGTNGRPSELYVKGVKLFSPSEIMAIGTYVYTGQNKIVTNELVVTVSKDGGQTFSETLVDKYEGSKKYADSLTFEGNMAVIGQVDGSSFYFSKDNGLNWQKTVPPFEGVTGKPSLLPNGLLRVLRVGPRFKSINICSFQIGGAETWSCDETSLDISKVNSSRVIGGLSFLDETVGFIALGMSESIFGGVFSNQSSRNSFLWFTRLLQPVSCYEIKYVSPTTLLASCVLLDASRSGPNERVTSFSSVDGGQSWVNEYYTDHPYPILYQLASHRLSNGKTRIFLSDYQRYSIGELP